MRVVLNPQLAIGQIDIERIPLDPQSRDDIPAVLRGLQQIWSDAELRAKLFTLLETHLLADKSRRTAQTVRGKHTGRAWTPGTVVRA